MKWNRKNLCCWISVAVVLTLALPVHADPVGDTWSRWGDLWSWFAGWWKAGIDRDPNGRADKAGIDRDPWGVARDAEDTGSAGIDSDPWGAPQGGEDEGSAGINSDPWG
jgi:hypothetical protein